MNLERRLGDFETVEELYKLAFSQAYSSGQDTLVLFVSSHYAKFHLYVRNNPEKMIEIYEKALNEISSKKSLYLAYIRSLAHMQDVEIRLESTRKTYEKAISKESEVIFIYEGKLTEAVE